jgi:phospholipid/cholesterol/gamma-HCH transport system ATP-binding protein
MESVSENSKDTIVELKEVYKTFGKNKVLRGLTCAIPKGQISFIIGRSGEGKSVTLKHIVGVLKPDSGTVSLFGEVMPMEETPVWRKTRRRLGLLFQDGALFDSLSVFENVAFTLREIPGYGGKKMEERVEYLLELVGLPGSSHRMPPELSIGEKKRVGLARALAQDPEIIMYDEPTTGMDPFVSDLVDSLIVNLQAKLPHLTSIVISHDVGSILKVAQQIYLLHEGILYKKGTPEEFKNSKDPLIEQFLSGSVEGPLANPIV